MEQQIMVYDSKKNVVGTTFNRRAKQLVTKQRAQWVDETHTAICLIEEKKEIPVMDDKYSSRSNSSYEVVEISESSKASELHDDKCLLCVAKKRVRETRNLLIHVLIYAFSSFTLLMIYSMNGYGFEQGLIIGILCAWTTFFARDVGIYIYHRLKGVNIVNRFFRDPVQTEYMKLKAMNPSQITEEYKRI